MTFVQIETRNGMVNLDGYSRNKTLKGALKDLAREVAKIDEGEASAITDNIDEYMGMVVDGMLNEPNCFYIEAEEVHCASRYSEKNDEMEYAEGHWYLYIRICAKEQETAQTASAPAADETVSTLTEEEVKFFNDTVARIKYSVNVRVPIEPMNHEQLTGTNKEALGICWAEDDGTGKPVPFRITIDEFFIHECFLALDKPYMKIEPETLEQVIAHEIAHLYVWRHGKKHTELTERICRLIEKGEPHGLEDSGTASARQTGPVTMAAMQSTATETQGDTDTATDEQTGSSLVYMDDTGVARCGNCGAELLCNGTGDMSDSCPQCRRRLEYDSFIEPEGPDADRYRTGDYQGTPESPAIHRSG